MSIKPPHVSDLIGEVFSGLSWGATLLTWPLLSKIEQGDGHPVLVLPGLLTTDAATWPLRKFLDDRGYATYPWDQGMNRGPLPEVMEELVQKINEIYEKHQKPISLVGWSMGGLLLSL